MCDRISNNRRWDGGKTYFGSPAQDARVMFKEMAYIKKIPEILQKLKNLS